MEPIGAKMPKNASVFAPAICGFADARLQWHNGKPSEGGGGRAEVDATGELLLKPEPQRDYWSRTFYHPTLIKSNGQSLLASVPVDAEVTLSLAFTLHPKNQFDQAGAMILVDEGTWCKAGIEWCDGDPKLSCVVTNDGFSDWSTQSWPLTTGGGKTVSCRLRVHRVLPGPEQGPALVFEAASWSPGVGPGTPAAWKMVRIASLRSGDAPWRMGCMSYAPMATGGSARFHYLRIGPREAAVHDADASAMA